MTDSELKKFIHREIANATVKIFVDGAFQGTGFFITPDGYVLTAHHCIANPPPDEIIVETCFKETFSAELDTDKSLKHKDFDIAVLKINYSTKHCLPLGTVSTQNILGESDIVAPGYPAGNRPDNQDIGIYTGNISRFRADNRIENDAMKGMGQSGGPVYHYATQRVVGLAAGGYKNEIMLNAGLAVRFEMLFERWAQLEHINNQVAHAWDECLKPASVGALESATQPINLRLITIKQQLIPKRPEIANIWSPVIAYLRNLEKVGIDEEAEDTLDIVADFLADRMSTEKFINFWQKNTVPDLNYAALAERLKQGEIAVFLGSDMPAKLAPQLAEYVRYQEVKDSFPKICEYVELNDIEYSRTTLRHRVQEFVTPISPLPVMTSLYELLANVPESMILIYSGYDTLLEDTFKHYDKKFVVLSHSHHAQERGRIFIRYFDKKEPEHHSTESLSGLELSEQGYSLIYKINGCFNLNVPPHTYQKDSLMLSEHDYFEFARYIDKLIPDYVTRHINVRGFWFLGQYPHSWENRLIMHAILEKRPKNSRALTIHKGANQFANIYWKAKGVDNYPIELGEFVKGLRAHI